MKTFSTVAVHASYLIVLISYIAIFMVAASTHRRFVYCSMVLKLLRDMCRYVGKMQNFCLCQFVNDNTVLKNAWKINSNHWNHCCLLFFYLFHLISNWVIYSALKWSIPLKYSIVLCWIMNNSSWIAQINWVYTLARSTVSIRVVYGLLRTYKYCDLLKYQRLKLKHHRTWITKQAHQAL